MFSNLKSYERLLGGVTRNGTGHIIAAKSLTSFWMTHVNFSAVDMDKTGNMAGTAEWVPLRLREHLLQYFSICVF